MSSSIEFVQYVCDQLVYAGEITYKPLFGEYGIYVDSIYCGAVCDNQFFVKDTVSGKQVLNNITYGEMYPGAKPAFLIENLQDNDCLTQLMIATKTELEKKQRKKLSKLKKTCD